jgi:hypothetical protein
LLFPRHDPVAGPGVTQRFRNRPNTGQRQLFSFVTRKGYPYVVSLSEGIRSRAAQVSQPYIALAGRARSSSPYSGARNGDASGSILPSSARCHGCVPTHGAALSAVPQVPNSAPIPRCRLSTPCVPVLPSSDGVRLFMTTANGCLPLRQHLRLPDLVGSWPWLKCFLVVQNRSTRAAHPTQPVARSRFARTKTCLSLRQHLRFPGRVGTWPSGFLVRAGWIGFPRVPRLKADPPKPGSPF